MFVDAAFKEEMLEFGAGYAIFDLSGTIMAAEGRILNPPGSVLGAELKAIKLRMEFCLDNNIEDFHIFSDSQDTVHAIRSRGISWVLKNSQSMP